MSVAVPVVDSWDGPNRRIYLKQGVTTFHWIEDMYREYRNWRRLDESSRIWLPFMYASGNEPKGGGKYTPRYVTLLDGVKVIPYDENIRIEVTGEAITDNADVDPSLFDTSTRTEPIKLYITPPASELVVVAVDVATISGIAAVVWDEATALHTISGTYGKAISDINLETDGLAQAGEYDTRFTNLASDVTDIHSKLPAGTIASAGEYNTDFTEIKTNLERALGLMQENYYIDQTSYADYNGVKLMTSGRMRIYSDAVSVGTANNVIATYQVTTDWSNDEMTSYKVVKV